MGSVSQTKINVPVMNNGKWSAGYMLISYCYLHVGRIALSFVFRLLRTC